MGRCSVVRIRIWRAEGGAISGFALVGHAGAGSQGQDVVCAGVSALAQTAVLGLERRLGLQPEVDAGDGRLVCRLPQAMVPEQAARAQDVLETMCLGLSAIVARYPRQVRLRDVPLAARAAIRRVAPIGHAPSDACGGDRRV